MTRLLRIKMGVSPSAALCAAFLLGALLAAAARSLRPLRRRGASTALLGLDLLSAVVLISTSAQAAPLRWDGTLSIELGLQTPAVIVGTGVATVNPGNPFAPHLTSVRMAGGISGSVTLPVTDPEVTVDGIVAVGLQITGSAGTWAVPPGIDQIGTSPALVMNGLVKICLFDPSCLPGGFLALPLAAANGVDAVGVGGLITVGGGGSIRISIVANPWVIGEATTVLPTLQGGSTTVFLSGSRRGPAGLSSTTALPGGFVKTVTPVMVQSSSGQPIGIVLTRRMRFVPEPGPSLMLLSGALGLVLIGRTRLRRRHSDE